MSFKVEKFMRWLPARRGVLAWMIMVGVSVIASWLHLFSRDQAVHLTQLYVVFWFGIPLIYWCLSSPAERGGMLDLTVMMRYLRAGIRAGIYLGGLFYFMDRAVAPADPWLRQWYDSLNLYAGGLYLVWCLYWTCVALIQQGRVVIYEWLLTTCGYVWAWACLRWLVSSGAIAAQQLYHADPPLFYQYCGMVVIVVVLWVITRKVSQGLSGSAGQAQSYDGVGSGFAMTPLLTKLDKKRIACHEAGHVIVWAAVSPVPECVAVHCFGMHNGIGGYVRGPVIPHQFPPLHVETFRMLLDLAGKEAEWVLLNEIGCSDGESATSDEAKWQARAKSYLSQQSDQLFYIDPQSPAEAAFNANALTALRCKHQALLRELMSVNRGLLLKIVQELETVGHINNAGVKAYLKDVVLPDQFPSVEL